MDHLRLQCRRLAVRVTEGPLVAAPLVAALERLRGNATLRRHISWNARCFWKRHFGHVDDIMRRFVCGLSARQRKS